MTGSCGFQKNLQGLNQTTTFDFFAFLQKITTTETSHFLSPNGQDYLLTIMVRYTLHYHLQVQANHKKMYKKTMLFLASMGETGLTHDIFFLILT